MRVFNDDKVSSVVVELLSILPLDVYSNSSGLQLNDWEDALAYKYTIAVDATRTCKNLMKYSLKMTAKSQHSAAHGTEWYAA